MLPGRLLEIALGSLIGAFGFSLLARLDVPLITHGGSQAIAPAIELGFAAILLLGSFVVAALDSSRPPTI
ncbi:MAG TPA: hypothetical protein VFA78_06965 [Chloroflexota bacterium]|nr:hypothetical protein [Chloroflexota bacterium]